MESIERKTNALKQRFESLKHPSAKYEYIIQLGKMIKPLENRYKTPSNLVRGCQSELYLHSELNNGKIFFYAGTDAIITAGLAALLIDVYSGQDLETVISFPPHFLETLGIHASLSPNRSQGISHIYLKMKLQAILFAKTLLEAKK